MKKFNKLTTEAGQNVKSVSVAIDETKLLCDMVEELARFRQSAGFQSENSPVGWNSIETSSLEAYVSGTLSIDIDGEVKSPSFVSSFVFTCIRPLRGDYTLSWMNSMS